MKAQYVGQADGLRQRQPKSAAEDESLANMTKIIAGIHAIAPLAQSAMVCDADHVDAQLCVGGSLKVRLSFSVLCVVGMAQQSDGC